MKESGIEWIGEIPEEWNVRKMKYCGELDSNGVDKKQRDGEKLFKSVHYMDVYTNSLHEIGNSDDYLIISADDKKAEMCTLKQGDVLLTTSSENPEDIGHSTEISEDLDKTLFGYHLMRFRATMPLALHLRKYLIGSYLMRQWFEYRSVGMTRYGLSRSDIADAKLILPPFAKQQQIASFLDTKSSLIDSTIQKEREVIHKLKEYRQAVITEAVTKGIRPGVLMKDSGVEWIGEIPEHWNCVDFRRAVHLKQGLQIEQTKRFSDNGDKRFVYITLKYVNSNKKPEDTEYIENPDSNVMCGYDDILFVRTGATGLIVTNVFGVYHNNFFKIIFEKTLLSKKYLIGYLSQKSIQAHFNLLAGTTTISDLNHGDFLSTKVLIPPLPEQQEIADYLDAKCSAIDATIQKRELAIEKLTAYKQSLIYECVTGKKEVLG